MPSPFIYINGYPGIGKLSIARELCKLIPNSKILDNHRLIDPVAAVYERTMPEYQPLRAAVRNTVLHSIATSTSTQEVTWIFTDQQSTDSQGSSTAQDYLQAARRRGSQFISIVLNCSMEENIRRLTMEGRGGTTNTKLTDVDIMLAIRATEDIYHFGGEDEMDLDISSLSVVESALAIHRFFVLATSRVKEVAS